MKNKMIMIVVIIILTTTLVGCKTSKKGLIGDIITKKKEEIAEEIASEEYEEIEEELIEGDVGGIPQELTTDGVIIYKQDEIKNTDIVVEFNGELIQYNEKYNQGETGDVKIIIFRERSLVPLRELAEKLEYEIAWEGAGQKQALTITGANMEIVSTLNSNKYIITKDGISQTVYSESPTIKYDGKIYVPARFVGETFGVDVYWNSERRVVEITN